jgi:hypothetical protein
MAKKYREQESWRSRCQYSFSQLHPIADSIGNGLIIEVKGGVVAEGRIAIRTFISLLTEQRLYETRHARAARCSVLEWNKVYGRLIISTGLALVLLAGPTSSAARNNPIQIVQIADNGSTMACAPGDLGCRAPNLPPRLQAPGDLNNQQHKPSLRLRLPRDQNNQVQKLSRKLHAPGDLKKWPHKPCPPAIEKCRPHKPPPKHRHRHFHDYPYFYDYYGNQDYYVNLPSPYPYYLVSCRSARIILQDNGFRKIKLIRCGGKYHSFTARKRGANYLVKVKASSGRIVIVRRTK